MKTGVHSLIVDFFGVLTLTFNGLLLYSLIENKDSVTSTLWTMLLVREICGFIYFLVVYARKWLAVHESTFSSAIAFVYFFVLFGFALTELIVMVKDDNATALTSANLPLPVFAWFFVVVDWLFVFCVFMMGVFVYDDTVPSFLLYSSSQEAEDSEDTPLVV